MLEWTRVRRGPYDNNGGRARSSNVAATCSAIEVFD